MIHFIFSPKDRRYLFLKGDTPEDDEAFVRLKDWMNLVDPICYLPSWRLPTKKTEDFLYGYNQPTGDRIWYCAAGLWQAVYMFLRDNNIPFDGLVENKDVFKHTPRHTYDEFRAIVDSWHLALPPRDYQYEATYKILQWRQSVSSLSTRAGKTLIAYMVFRYMRERMGARKILAIVPSVSLVKQMYQDFKDYGDWFRTECIWSQGKLVESADFTVGTFQSLIKFLDRTDRKYDPSFFNGYDVMFVDEVHRATASQIRMILRHATLMNDLKIAFGMTGTLPKEHTIPYYTLHALLGAKIQDISPKELMDEGYISKVDIRQVRLNWTTDKSESLVRGLWRKAAEYCVSEYTFTGTGKERKKVPLKEPKFMFRYEKNLPAGVLDAWGGICGRIEDPDARAAEYAAWLKKFIPTLQGTSLLQAEQMMLHFLDARVGYLLENILPVCDRNTLVLAHHTDYIRYITKRVKERYPDRHVAVITGSVTPKKRSDIIRMMREHDDCVLVASYGTMSTGITLHNLCFGVLFESFKSEVVNIQSIGRGLGLSDNKDVFTVYDVTDRFPEMYASDRLYAQGRERMKLYKEYRYPCEVINVRL
jgi:superfamily II DNA or RNA helicase